jgi:hypothetical protein
MFTDHHAVDVNRQRAVPKRVLPASSVSAILRSRLSQRCNDVRASFGEQGARSLRINSAARSISSASLIQLSPEICDSP